MTDASAANDRDLDALEVDANIARARTLPGWLYDDPKWFARCKERVFARAWHVRPEDGAPRSSGDLIPWTLLPRVLDEPLVLTRDHDDTLRCLSNVCTHRGMRLVDTACHASSIRCGYHGRRFGLDGAMLSAPGFEGCERFPEASDHLQQVQLGSWRSLLFANLLPRLPFETWFAPIRARLDAVVPTQMEFDRSGSPHFQIDANWALYCDNFLEGLHIPFVHPTLNAALDFDAYRTELFDGGTMQVGIAKDGELHFALPKSHPDAGQNVAAYYIWLFPGTMLNVYPWGMSVNIVLPQGPGRTKVVYLRYVWDATKAERGAGAGLDRVEQEDDRVVEACARGVRSRLYGAGRYSPKHERGVHHFHRLLVAATRTEPQRP